MRNGQARFEERVILVETACEINVFIGFLQA